MLVHLQSKDLESTQVREQYLRADVVHLKAHVGNGCGSYVEALLDQEDLQRGVQDLHPWLRPLSTTAHQLIHRLVDVGSKMMLDPGRRCRCGGELHGALSILHY